MKTIILNYGGDKDLVKKSEDEMFSQVRSESKYANEAIEFIDCHLRMKEEPFEGSLKKLTAPKFIYYWKPFK